jgi:TctA family transporter
MKRNQKIFWTRLLYIFFGASAVISLATTAWARPLEWARRTFPVFSAAVLAVVGAILGDSILCRAVGTPIGGFTFMDWRWSSYLWYLRFAGARCWIVLALPLLVMISACAERALPLATAIIMAAGLTLFCAVVFVKGLGIPLPIIGPGWPVDETLTDNEWITQSSAPGTPDSRESLSNLFYCFIGVFLGTAIGVLPGLGPTATHRDAAAGHFCIATGDSALSCSRVFITAPQYGGSTTSILVNLPGEAASVVTTLDGYQMARKGRAGAALAASAIGSFFAGTVATLLIAAFGPPMANMALKFGPAEYFSLMVMGLAASIVLAQGSLLHAIGMVVLGLLLGLIGTDVTSGTQRYTFGIFELADGIGFVTVAMGMFGLGEIIRNLENEEDRSVVISKITSLWPTKEDWRRMMPSILRGTAIGSVLGILPGSGSILGSFAAYSIEKKVSKNGSQFGTGMIEGVAAPESANNAGAQTSFIPMLTLGIPSNPVSALMVGAMIIHGIQPGPSVISEQPALFWGIVVSMWIGNLMLIIPQFAAHRYVGAYDHDPLSVFVSGDLGFLRDWSI